MLDNLDTRKEELSVEQMLRRVELRLRQSGDVPEDAPHDVAAPPHDEQMFRNLDLDPELYFTLDYAARIYDPRTVPGNTRFYRLKALFMRLLRLYTTRQVEFNATLLRIVNRLFDKLHESMELFNYFRRAEVRLQARIEASEAQHGAVAEQLQAQRQRIERLEGRERVLDRRLAHVESLENKLQHALAENIALRQRLDQLMLELAVLPASSRAGAATAAVSQDTVRLQLLQEHLYFPYLNEDRGPEDVIRNRVQRYLPFFRTSDGVGKPPYAYILDVGCGRGEFLDACRAAQVPARGIDVNHDMVNHCVAKGLEVECADAITYLQAVPDDALRGIISCHVIEHFTPQDLLTFLKLCVLKLAAGGRLVLETPNVTSFFALSMFYRDFTHQRPFHPDTVKFILEQCGMQEVTIMLLSPVAEELRLTNVDDPQMSENIRKLNDLLYGHLDYAVLGVKG